MISVAVLPFPGSRILAGWWKQLAPFQPQAIWVAHLFVHRVEALVSARHPAPLDTLPLLVLQSLALNLGDRLEALDDRLQLGRPLLRQLVRLLETDKLVEANPSGGWLITASGRASLENGRIHRLIQERRSFHFVENEQTAHSPHFLRLTTTRRPSGAPPADDWHFDPQLLEECLRQSREWKERHSFPLEVSTLLGPASDGVPDPSAAWQRIIVDQPEHILALLVLTDGGDPGGRLVALAVRQECWALDTHESLFVLETDWQQVLPDLAVSVPRDLWRQAWRAWCTPRDLPPAEVDGCMVHKEGHCLQVRAPRRLVERLQRLRSDALKGEAWLLAGTGRLRSAAVVEVTER
jgi:hypothetical protein